MAAVKSIKDLFPTHGVDKRMGLNFDQLWQQGYRPKKLHLGVKDPEYDGVDIRLDSILGWRTSLTFVSSTWSDGSPGPVAFNVKHGILLEKDIKKINRSQLGLVYIMVSNTESHFMNADTTLELFRELYGPAFHARRRFLELDDTAPGLLLADAFTGNHASLKGEQERRALLKEEFNIIPPITLPGGWSAKGQPCDQIHDKFRRILDGKLDAVLGLDGSILSRRLYEELPIGCTGTIKRYHPSNFSMETSEHHLAYELGIG